ncbi:hypothetical protein [Microbulbifer sp. PSTR4-B]|uniref:hypothetical protein n=1 Tax=Microbulbifer sp. PSTR4-B TaxID=3243396 RepID=UPI0040395DDC
MGLRAAPRLRQRPGHLWLVEEGHNQSKGDNGPDERPPYQNHLQAAVWDSGW